jgi:hypothetical protein
MTSEIYAPESKSKTERGKSAFFGQSKPGLKSFTHAHQDPCASEPSTAEIAVPYTADRSQLNFVFQGCKPFGNGGLALLRTTAAE